MPGMPPFDPTAGMPISSAREVFPDAGKLIVEATKEDGPCDEYRVAQVPDTPVFVLYGIRHPVGDEQGVVLVVCIRTHKGAMN